MSEIFYTYIYFDPSKGNEPFYVGKGKDNRAWDHLRLDKKNYFINKLKGMIEKGRQHSEEYKKKLSESMKASIAARKLAGTYSN